MIRSAQVGPDAVEDGRKGQERLARSLLSSLGLEGAIYACQQNCWDGVLKVLLASKDNRGRDKD